MGLCVSCADLDCRKVEFGKQYLEVADLPVSFTDSAVFSGILATACFPRKAVMGSRVFVLPFLFVPTSV